MNKLKEVRKAKGMTQAEVGKYVGVSQNTYSYWERGRVKIDHASLLRLAALFGVSVDYLLGRENDGYSYAVHPDGPPAPTRPGSKWIPVLGKVAAGTPIEAVEDILDYEEIDAQTAVAGDYFALQIKGDSMEPKISNGDVVIVRRQPNVETGDLAVVLVNGDEATVKRIKKRPEGIILIPTNPAYEPMFYSCADIQSLPVVILGKVIELRAKF